MIWHLRTNTEQRKMLYSVGCSFLTRVPGAAGLLWFLPLLHQGLGTADYAVLLSAMALGNAAGFFSGGTNTIGRRLVGEAYSIHNRKGEADCFVSLMVANLFAACVTIMVIALYCLWQHAGGDVLIIAGMVATTGFLSMYDDTRAAYNEHYITAMLLIVIQSGAYAIGLLLAVTRHNTILAALVMQGPYIAVSLTTMVLMLYRRPYLLRGKPTLVGPVLFRGATFAMADGLLMMTLSLSVVWMQATASADTSAWFATIVRLFQTFSMPVGLVLLPLSSYVRIRWQLWSEPQQHRLVRRVLGIGVVYAVIVTVALFVTSKLYVTSLLHLAAPNAYAVFFLFGTIIAYRSYSQIAYIVSSHAAHLSCGITGAVCVAALIGAVASTELDPLQTVSAYSIIGAVAIIGVLIRNSQASQIRVLPG